MTGLSASLQFTLLGIGNVVVQLALWSFTAGHCNQERAASISCYSLTQLQLLQLQPLLTNKVDRCISQPA